MALTLSETFPELPGPPRFLDQRKRALSSRQHFGLRAKNALAENPLVNNGMQQNAETTCVLGCVLKTQRFNTQ